MPVKVVLVIIILQLSILCAFADTSVNVGISTGVVRTTGTMAEVELEHKTHDYLSLTTSAGIFNKYSYVDAGIKFNFWRLSPGVTVAYLFDVPDMLTGHQQFKLTLTYNHNDWLAGRYTHISNGSGLINHRPGPNAGQDFLGVVFKF